MSKETSPAYQHYPGDYLSDINTQIMTLEEEGMYRRLMDYCWDEVILPENLDDLAALCKGKKPTARVLQCFTKIEGGYRHKRLDEERKKQEEWKKKCAKGGRASAHKRKKTKDKTTEQGSCDLLASKHPTKGQLNGNTSSSTSSSNKNTPSSYFYTAVAQKRAPKGFCISDEMREWAKKEIPDVDIDAATKVFLDHEFRSSHKDWLATWRNFMRNQLNFGSTNGGPRNAANQPDNGRGREKSGGPKFDPNRLDGWARKK